MSKVYPLYEKAEMIWGLCSEKVESILLPLYLADNTLINRNIIHVDTLPVPDENSSLMTGVIFSWSVCFHVHKMDFLPEIYERTRIEYLKKSDINFESNIENSLRYFLKVLKREVLFWVGFKETLLKEDFIANCGISETEILKLADGVILDCLGK